MQARRIRLLNTTPAAAAAGRWLAGQLDLGAAHEKTLRFGFDIVFSWLTGMGLVAAVSFLLGSFAQGLTAAAAAFILRVFSAGAHCSTSGRCALVTVVVYSTIGKAAAVHGLATSPIFVAATYTVSAACLFARTAPRDSRDLRNLRFRPVAVFVLLTYLLLSLQYLGHSSFASSIAGAVAAGCLWQSCSVTEPGARLIMGVDSLLDAVGVD
ncbi:MAG: hypothetical protein HPY55_05925 [Firmicutes bacterium]|nr:hypothetical protein [Bacillota bacterium]